MATAACTTSTSTTAGNSSSSPRRRSGYTRSPAVVGGDAGPSAASASSPSEQSSLNLKSENGASAVLKQTVIRLKRRIEDSPTKLLVVSCKRCKTEIENDDKGSPEGTVAGGAAGQEDETYSQVLRLVGTVAEEETTEIVKTVKSALSTTVGVRKGNPSEPQILFRRNIKSKSTKIAEKTRENVKKKSIDSRFRLVNSKRSVEAIGKECTDAAGWSEESGLLKLLDLVPESTSTIPKKKTRPAGFEVGNVTCNGVPMLKESTCPNEDEMGFVYDLYVSNDPCIEEFTSGMFLSVEEAQDELDYGRDYREDDEKSQYMDDDEDSNAEDNWRNDYPDSEEEGLRDDSYGGAQNYDYGDPNSDDELYGRLGGMHVGTKDDSSSDDDELIYGIDDDGANQFDTAYSRYKARIKKHEYSSEIISSPSDSDVE